MALGSAWSGRGRGSKGIERVELEREKLTISSHRDVRPSSGQSLCPGSNADSLLCYMDDWVDEAALDYNIAQCPCNEGMVENMGMGSSSEKILSIVRPFPRTKVEIA